VAALPTPIRRRGGRVAAARPTSRARPPRSSRASPPSWFRSACSCCPTLRSSFRPSTPWWIATSTPSPSSSSDSKSLGSPLSISWRSPPPTDPGRSASATLRAPDHTLGAVSGLRGGKRSLITSSPYNNYSAKPGSQTSAVLWIEPAFELLSVAVVEDAHHAPLHVDSALRR
jgi:hypothetical protein